MPDKDVSVQAEFARIENAEDYMGDNGEQLIAWNVKNMFDISKTDYVMQDGAWYYVEKDVTFLGSRPSVRGTVNLILKDGCRLDPKRGIEVGEGNTLHIWAQKGGTGKLESLFTLAFRPDSDRHAALGGNEGENAGSINIHGGIIQLEGNKHAAAIGGGKSGNGGTINIYGGNLDLKSGENAAGLGGGKDGYGGTIHIYNGTVNAKASTYGAGIGGGDHGSSGDIRIWNGTVNAWGGDGAAGIGGGYKGSGNQIAIYGGMVNAYAGCSFFNGAGAGIGGGDQGKSGQIEIRGGNVFAESEFVNGIFDDYQGAGIGGGNDGSADYIFIGGGCAEAHGWQAFGKGNDGSSEGTLEISGDVYAEINGTYFPYNEAYRLARAKDMILRKIIA